MKRVWCQHFGGRTWGEPWEEWPVVRATAKRVFIPRDDHEAQRILRSGTITRAIALYSLDRAKLEREGRVLHNSHGGFFYYTDAGKAARISHEREWRPF